MARYWENNGQPLADGRVCLVIDPEDGTHPLRTYGQSKDDVLEKVAKTLEHGQRMITRMRETPAASPAQSATPRPAAAPSVRLTADEQMTATADLANPSKAPQAIVKLVQHATGLNLTAIQAREQEQRIALLAESWEDAHPEFPGSLTNRKLLLNTTVLQAGGIGNVTAEAIEQTYRSLNAQGAFAELPEPQPNTPQVQPEETPAPRTVVRPRGATSYRSSTLRATAPVASSAPKYTRAQVDAMSSDELAEKYRTEPGFPELVASYSTRRATA